jgi:hypothetical protein
VGYDAPVAAEVLEYRRLLTGTAAVNALVVSSADGSVYGHAVTFTAAVAPATSNTAYPTGTVTFRIDGTARATVALNNGIANYSVSTLKVGSHSVVAVYHGDALFAASISPALTQVVTKSFVAPWQPTDVIDVTKFGVKGDGITDNTAALQNLINQIAPTITYLNPTAPDIFYFPAGTYLVSGTLDFSAMPAFGMLGAVNANGQPTSIIKGTATSGNLVTTSGGGTFQVWNMNFQASNAGETAFYSNYSIQSTFENCVFSGHIGLDLYEGFSTALRNDRFTGAGGAQGSSIGLLAELPTNIVVSDCDFSGWSEGLRAYGNGMSVVRSTFEKNGIGARLGADANGNNYGFGRSSLSNLTFTGNDVGIYFQIAGTDYFGDINIVGTSGAPSGQSKYGFTGAELVCGCIFSNLHVSGGFANAAANMGPSYLDPYASWKNTSFFGSTATNSLTTGKGWVVQLAPLSASDLASGMTQATITSAAMAEPVNIDNVTASNTVAAPQGATNVFNVTQYGIVGDGKTDDTAKLQALINSAKPGAIFYFPKGNYVVSATIDFSALSNFTLVGDIGVTGGAAGGSGITGNVDGALIKADYGAKAGTYHIRNLIIRNDSTSSNSIGLFTRNSILSSIQDSSIFGGSFGAEQINPFMLSMRSVIASGSIGLMISGGMASTVEDLRADGLNEGLRVGGATDFALFAADLEVDGIAIDLGLDPSGNPSVVTRASIQGVSFEADGIGLDLKNCSQCFVIADGFQGHTNAATPNLIDSTGLLVEDGVHNSTFAALAIGGYYVAGPAVQVTSGASNLLFIDSAAWNGDLMGLTNPSVWDIESTNGITLTSDR